MSAICNCHLRGHEVGTVEVYHSAKQCNGWSRRSVILSTPSHCKKILSKAESTCSKMPESLYCRSKTGGLENKGEIWSSMMPPPGPAVPLPLSSLFTALTHPASCSSFETQLTHYCSQLVRVTNTHRNLFTAMTSSFTEIQCVEWTDSIKG